MFSIVIPSWNNLAYLKLCVESLKKHSKYEHEILVHLNDGSDGSLEWVKAEGISTRSLPRTSVSVCLSTICWHRPGMTGYCS